MEGVGTRLNVGIKDVTGKVAVPKNDVARLMYYLRCVTVDCGLDILHDDLVDYANYARLSRTRQDAVFIAALKYSPDVFEGKTLFYDEDIPENYIGKFFEVNAALDLVAVQRNVLVGGRVSQASYVYIAKRAFLEHYYRAPIERNQQRLERILGLPSAAPKASASTSPPKVSTPKASASASPPKVSPPKASPPKATSPPNRTQAKKKPSGHFYLDMSVGELRAFLQEHGEPQRGPLEKGELRRKVWECYVESLGKGELDDFLRVNNIRLAGTPSIRSKREAVKATFRAAPKPSVPTGVCVVSSARDLHQDQTVTVMGLKSAAHLNGKVGRVLIPEAQPGRAEVQVDDEAVRIQFKNLRIGGAREVD